MPISRSGSSILGDYTAKTANYTLLPSDRVIAENATPATRTSFLLPATCPVGRIVAVSTGANTGGWRITQGTGQRIKLPDNTLTTSGASGYLDSDQDGTSVLLVCITADTIFEVVHVDGRVKTDAGAYYGESAAATANTVAKRTAAGRIVAAAGATTGDVATYDQVPGLGAALNVAPIDAAYARSAADWVSEGPLMFSSALSTAIAGGSCAMTSAGTGVLGISANFLAHPDAATEPVDGGATEDAGVVTEVVAVFSADSLPSVTGTMSGVSMSQSVASQFTSGMLDTVSSESVQRVGVGFNSTGEWKIYTSNGTTLTATATGITYVAGTKVKIKIVLTKGTNVVVTIDAASPITVTATLPTRTIPAFGFGKANTAASDRARCYGGFWRITGA